MHKKDLEKGIASLAVCLRPNLCIIDGIVSMDGDGPHHGRTRKTNVLVYSDNMLEADYLASFIIGYIPDEIQHINYAINLGVGKAIPKEIIEGFDKYKILDFKLPEESLSKIGLTVWPTTACSQCIFNLAKTRNYILRSAQLLFRLVLSKKGTYNVVIGRADNLQSKPLSNIIAIGNCAKNFSKTKGVCFLDGCPPTTMNIYKFIKKCVIKHK